MNDADRLLQHLGDQELGIISRDEALKAGMSEASIDRRLANGSLISIHPRVYQRSGMPACWEGDLLAACKWAGEESFASHRSAARVWGLDGIEASLPEISCYTGRRRSGVLIHRLRPEDQPRTRVLNGIPVSLVERTLLDLAGVVPPRVTGLAIDDALRRRITNLDRLWKVWETDGGMGRKGTKNLRRLLAMRDHRNELLATKFENKMLRILRRIDPARLVAQCRVKDGAWTFYIDFAYPNSRLGIECHSLKWHMGEAMTKDLRRDRRLKLLGWTILYYSWDDVVFTPDQVEAEIRAFLARAS